MTKTEKNFNTTLKQAKEIRMCFIKSLLIKLKNSVHNFSSRFTSDKKSVMRGPKNEISSRC